MELYCQELVTDLQCPPELSSIIKNVSISIKRKNVNDREFKTKPPDYYLSQGDFCHRKASSLLSLEAAVTSRPLERLLQFAAFNRTNTQERVTTQIPTCLEASLRQENYRAPATGSVHSLLQYPSPKFHYIKQRLVTTGPGWIP